MSSSSVFESSLWSALLTSPVGRSRTQAQMFVRAQSDLLLASAQEEPEKLLHPSPFHEAYISRVVSLAIRSEIHYSWRRLC